uniref:LIM and calponin homology domains-containing protein 1-like n=1 Tax=Nothobranchius furzeri TaxID=105023 RepID=A0A8C6NXQ1_NOTFU
MASPACGNSPGAPPREQKPMEPSHPEPAACQEAQKWVEAVTGKSFGDKDFRSALENGILLCELLTAIKPGLVKKINRLPTPIAGLDNLSVFLRGCEELGLKGSQLFDPGDLQNTSICANLKDSDCNRKLKNVLNTVFWLGKAASGCPSYSGPTLNLKEFEGLLAQMKVENEDGADSPQQRSVRDSGYDCWDSERSESLSPPRHTRDNSLDSLDSFGSRSQHSPSPDVVNRVIGDGRGSDSEADASNRKPDVRKDDMLARRTAKSESRCSIPFNQFLPNRTNASSYVPAPRRKQHTEEVEQRSPPTSEDKEVKPPSPNIILRSENDFLNSQSSAWDSSSEGEEEMEKRKVPDVHKDDLASRRVHHIPVVSKVHQFLPPPVCTSKDRERWERIRRASQRTLQEEETREKEAVSDIITRKGNPFLKEGGEEEDVGKERMDEAIPNKQTDDLARRRAQSRPLPHREGPVSFVPSSMSPADLQKWERLKMTEPSFVDDAEPSQSTSTFLDLQPWTLRANLSAAEVDARFAQYEQRVEAEEEEDEEEEERIPDLQKDDMMARRTGVFQKPAAATVSHQRFLPLPGSKRSTQAELATDAAPRSKKEVQRSRELNVRVDHQHPRVPMETPQQHLEEKNDENEPDLEKDDMMARKTKSFQKTSAIRSNQCFSQFLPTPGSVKYSMSPASAAKEPLSRPKLTQHTDRESLVTVAAEHQAPPSQVPTSPTCSGLRARKEGEEQEKGDVMNVPDPAASGVTKLPPTPSLVPPPPSPPPAQLCGVHMEKVDVKPEKKPFWLENNLPPMMVSRRVAFQLDNESVSMGDMGNDEELGHLPSLSRYERMHEQYNSFREDEDHWQDDLARWKTRRRSASQELIKKEEERKQMEKRMKDEEGDSNKRKNIKTYKEIVEEKERREAELCEAYRNAATPEEAALVLQRYALRFTISDATLDSLKLPRSTAKTKQEQNREEEEERKLTSPVSDAEKQEHLHKPNSAVATNQRQTQPEYIETDVISEQEKSRAIPNHSPAPNGSVLTETNTQDVPLGLGQLQKLPTESPPAHQEQLITEEAQPQTKDAPPQNVQTVSLHPPSPVPSRPLPLLVAKPFCQPRSTFSGHKPIKVDGLVQVKGEATEDFPSLLVSLQENKDVSSKQTEEDVCPEPAEEKTNTTEQPAPPQTEKSASFTGSAISSLIGGRNCIVTTTIVTELTQTHMEPLHPEIQSKGPDGTAADQESALPAESPSSIEDYSPTITENVEESSVSIETPMLNLAKRVNHWVWDPNEERKRLEMWQQEHEHLLQEQYEKEQEKLKKEWEKAQQEVEEEERKHNEEERRILEETVAPLSPSGLLQSEHTRTAFSENNNKTAGGTVTPQQNGRKILTGNEDQHSSKLHFFQDSSCDGESSKKQELWKTASLDRNPQLNQSQSVKRSGSHDAVTSNQPSSPPTPQPPSPSRCVSGRRLCSGCSKPLGKGAAMIIDTLGLFFHVQCFKCGACNGQLGDATTGTDVRIRNGQLSCYECYIASRGKSFSRHVSEHRGGLFGGGTPDLC